jgi:hypothetical protein
MDFKKATDELTTVISHQELAQALKVSVATVRQARLGQTAKAYRNPPQGWETVLKRLAEKRAAQLVRLAAQISA